MRSENFAGNRETLSLLSSYVDSGRFPHALLIEGPSGSGRRTLARLFANAAVCVGEGEKPCGICAACRKAAAFSHPDIEEIGGEGGARSFHIDAVRDLRERAYVLPNEAPRRVMILAGADGMTVQAQNALLKILEEPPASLLFILTCENRALLLPTVLSRTVGVTLHGVDTAQGLPVLKQHLPQANDDTLRNALELYDGCIGRALAAAESDDLTRVQSLANAVAAAVAAPQEWELLTALAPLDQKDKTLTDDVLAALHGIFCDALAASQGAHRASDTAVDLSRRLPAARLAALTDAVCALQETRRRNINHTLLLTLISSRLRTAAG